MSPPWLFSKSTGMADTEFQGITLGQGKDIEDQMNRLFAVVNFCIREQGLILKKRKEIRMAAEEYGGYGLPYTGKIFINTYSGTL